MVVVVRHGDGCSKRFVFWVHGGDCYSKRWGNRIDGGSRRRWLCETVVLDFEGLRVQNRKKKKLS